MSINPTPNPIDAHVGERIRNRRAAMGLTQTDLGAAIGVKFQQIQKYETGANRVSASRLYATANRLKVPVHFFFEGLPATPADPLRITSAQEIALLQRFRRMEAQQRVALSNLAAALADTPNPDERTAA